MFERFTDRARRVLVLAQDEARLLNHNFIGTEHILLGLIHEGEGVVATVLDSVGISLSVVRQRVSETIGPAGPSSLAKSPPFTPRAKKVIELSLREALQLGHNYIGTEHMLLGLIREGEGVAAQVLESLGVDLARVRQQVIALTLEGHVEGAMLPDPLAAVDGERVEQAPLPMAAGEVFTWEDANAALADLLVGDATTTRREVEGVVYETMTYRPRPSPEISLSVASARIPREAFDDYTQLLAPDAQEIEGLGDAATYSPRTHSLRVLVGSTLIVVQVRSHPLAKAAAIAAAERVLANIARK